MFSYKFEPEDQENDLKQQREKDGLRRTLFVEKCDVNSFLRYFSHLKQSSQIFIFPHHLKESKQNLHIWDAQDNVENIFIDLMSELDKQNIRMSRHHNTFRKT